MAMSSWPTRTVSSWCPASAAEVLGAARCLAGREAAIEAEVRAGVPLFLALPCPRMFMYGEANYALSYLPELAAGDVELAEIPRSGHWPMYANPVAMWDRIAAFIR